MMPATNWQSPPAGPSLGPSDVHVWRLALAQAPDQLARFAGTLSADEVDRAARFHFDRDRNAYTATRGALRALAAHYAGCTPGALTFGYRDRGKPYLSAPAGDLRLNVSHSGGYALLAFTRGRELGVDVEHKRPLFELGSLAEASFSPAEYAAWCRLPPPDRLDAFFAIWSRKEAFIKATGEGVAQLAEFDVSVRADEPARLLRMPGGVPWRLYDLPAIAEYSAAIVVPGDGIAIHCFDWPPAR